MDLLLLLFLFARVCIDIKPVISDGMNYYYKDCLSIFLDEDLLILNGFFSLFFP